MGEIRRFVRDDLAGATIPPEVSDGLAIFETNPNYCIMSCLRDGKVFAAIGIRRLHRTCGEAFVIPFGIPPALTLHRCTKELIQYAFTELGYNRIQATAVSDNAHNQRWLSSLGLTCEGLLKGFDPITGKDHLVYGRVK